MISSRTENNLLHFRQETDLYENDDVRFYKRIKDVSNRVIW